MIAFGMTASTVRGKTEVKWSENRSRQYAEPEMLYSKFSCELHGVNLRINKASLVINSQFSCVTNIKQEIDYFECAAVNILNLN